MITVKCKVDVKLKFKKPKSDQPIEPIDEATIQRRGKVPRISRLMALAIRMDEMLRRGEAQDTTELADHGRVTQPRITQILSLSLLAPDIQEALLFLPRETNGKSKIHEKSMRPLTVEPHWDRQRTMWTELVESRYTDGLIQTQQMETRE